MRDFPAGFGKSDAVQPIRVSAPSNCYGQRRAPGANKPSPDGERLPSRQADADPTRADSPAASIVKCMRTPPFSGQRQSMIRTRRAALAQSGQRFSEKIMLKQKDGAR
jgi:hypothetical protein